MENTIKKWQEGDNIGHVATFVAGLCKDPKDPHYNYTVYRVSLINLYGKQLNLQYLVPHEKKPTKLLLDLKDCHTFLDAAKRRYWYTFTLKPHPNDNRLLQIVKITQCSEGAEEMNLLSLKLRGGRINLQSERRI